MIEQSRSMINKVKNRMMTFMERNLFLDIITFSFSRFFSIVNHKLHVLSCSKRIYIYIYIHIYRFFFLFFFFLRLVIRDFSFFFIHLIRRKKRRRRRRRKGKKYIYLQPKLTDRHHPRR